LGEGAFLLNAENFRVGERGDRATSGVPAMAWRVSIVVQVEGIFDEVSFFGGMGAVEGCSTAENAKWTILFGRISYARVMPLPRV